MEKFTSKQSGKSSATTTTEKRIQPCKTCEDTETGIPCGKVLSNDVGASGKEYFSLMDCPTCKGQKFIYQ